MVADAVYTSPHEAVPPTWYLPTAQFDIPGLSFASVRLSVRAEAGPPAALIKSCGGNRRSESTPGPDVSAARRPDSCLTDEGTSDGAVGRRARCACIAARGTRLVRSGRLWDLPATNGDRDSHGIGRRPDVGGCTRARAGGGSGRHRIIAGTAISLWAIKFVDGLIYVLPPREPTTLLGAAVVLCVMGGLAVWLPRGRPRASIRSRCSARVESAAEQRRWSWTAR